MSTFNLTTERMTLREFMIEDIDALFQIMNEPEVMRYFPRPGPPPRERVEGFVQRQITHWEEHHYGYCVVVVKGGKEIIGWNGLSYLPETDEVELGYLLSKAYWGKGLATEAGQASLRFGFDVLGQERIIAIIHPENLASQRVALRLGMTFWDRNNYFGMDCFRYFIDREQFMSGLPSDKTEGKE